MKKKHSLLFLLIAVTLFFTACIKDTDFSQTDTIEATPVVELDFLFFDVNSQNFTDIGINNLIVTDTTYFDFLNEDFAIDNIERAEFFFKFKNTLPVNIVTEFQFLDQDNQPHYIITIPANAGLANNPAITEHTENIEAEEVINLTMAEKVVINIVASSSVENLEGSLNLQSKTTYYLKITQ